MIRAVLHDLERRKSWVKWLKDVAYEADDVLDEFSYEILRRKVEIRNQKRRKVLFFFSTSNPIAFRLKMGKKIKDINTSLEKINKDAINFGLERGGVGVAPPQVVLNRESDSFVDSSRVIGRENEAFKIVEILVKSGDHEALSVIPIVGMGGIGKTTLAKLIYNDKRINSHFDVKIWVCVSNNFHTKRLLTEILESLKGGKKCDLQSSDAVLREIENVLKNKKYFLILDDVWDEDPYDWDFLRSCLLAVNKTKGNNIIVTTRKQGVASIMGTHKPHFLEGLSEEDCWSIVKQKAFAIGGAKMTPELETIGIEIARKCHGVPLAAHVVGGMLFAKKERQEWLEVQNSQIWGLANDEYAVSDILKLSFNNLPYSSLKQCFAYCSIFPKNSFIEKEKLIELWMAMGFLQLNEGTNNSLMKDKGNEFFNVLLRSSLFQDVEKDQYDNIVGCQMHNLVHNLAHSISGCAMFYQQDGTGKVSPHIRHLTLCSSGETIDKMLKVRAAYLKTLVLKSNLTENLADFKSLRVLSFDGVGIQELPDSISLLIHLRYLDLSNNGIKFLPISICKLYNLQTLRLDGCRLLRELPNKLSNLLSLRNLHLDTYDHHFKIPVGIGRLVWLQTLPFFSVGKDKGYQLSELGFMKYLRGELEIRELEHVSGREEAQRAELIQKTHLYELSFEWSNYREGVFNDEDVLEGIQPHQNLKRIRVSRFLGDKFPKWMMQMVVNIDGNGVWLPLDSLMEIKLEGCKRCEHIPMLGQLPNLRYLRVWGMNNVRCIELSFYGLRTNGSSELFPALIKFSLKDMPNLERWMEAADYYVVFPRLEDLTIERCPKLTTFPSHFSCLKKLVIVGLDELGCLPDELGCCSRLLQQLEIRNCKNLISIASIQGLTSLTKLFIRECDGLTCLPSGLLQLCTSLQSLRIDNCINIISVPEITTCCSLSYLTLVYCEKLSCLPLGLGCLTRLGYLSLGPLSDDVTSFSGLNEIPHFTALTELRLHRYGEESFPDCFSNLSSLTDLFLQDCQRLKCLPSGEPLSQLEDVIIHNCPLLKERWSEIAPHAKVTIDGTCLSDMSK